MPRDAALWRSVDELLEKGTAPVVTLPPSSKIVKPKKPIGRPRLRTTEGKSFYHWPMHTPSGHRSFCRASGCRKRLKKKQLLVCSEACEANLREECTMMLGVLDGTVDVRELPPHLRTQKLRRKRTL